MYKILDQIQFDLADLQAKGVTHESLIEFYDRMCANVTDYETLLQDTQED